MRNKLSRRMLSCAVALLCCGLLGSWGCGGGGGNKSPVAAADPTPRPPVPTDFYTTSGTSDLVRYDATGKIVETLTTEEDPSLLVSDLRGVGLGPDGLLYVVSALRRPPTGPGNPAINYQGFIVVTLDAEQNSRLAFVYAGDGQYIGSNASSGKIAFDRNNHLLVGTAQGVVQFPLGGGLESGTILWKSDDPYDSTASDTYDIAVLPSGNLLVMTNQKVLEMAGDGTNARPVITVSAGRGVAYDAATNTVFVTMIGSTVFNGVEIPFALAAYDGTTYAIKNAISFIYGDDMDITNDGRLVVGSRTQPPGIFDKDFNRLGAFEDITETPGDGQMFIAQRGGAATAASTASRNKTANTNIKKSVRFTRRPAPKPVHL